MQPTVTSPPSKKKGKYDITFKLKVIQWAEKHSNRAAGSKFGLNESTIRGWRKSAVANSLEALSEISRGVISIHSVQQPQQQQHQPTPAITKSAPKQIQTSESKLPANQNVHHISNNNNNNIIINGGGNGNNHSSNGVGGGGGGGNNNHHRNSHGSHPYHNHHMNHHHLSNRHSILKGGSRPSSRPVSPPETLAMDERDLARLSCSPSDDSHYDEGSYQEEEVVESPPPSPPLVSQPQHHSYQQQQQQQQQSANLQQQQYQMQQLHTQQAHQHLHVPQQHQQSHSQQSSQVLKTISHQVTSRPYPELQIPFTVIVCKSVRDHWLEQFAVEKPQSDSEIDAFARVLGLERR